MAKKETARQKQMRLRREARSRRTRSPKNIAPGTGRSRASRSRTVPSLMKKGETYGNPGTSPSSSTKNPRSRSSRRPGLIGPPAPKAPTRSRQENRRSSSSATPKTTPRVTAKVTPKAPKTTPKVTPKAPKAPKTTPKAPKTTPKAPKTTRKTSTTKGPTKSGGFYQSKGSSTKGGPTKSGSSYASKRKPRSWVKDNYKPGAKGVKSSRLSKALTNLKVRDYSKKKKK